MHSITLDSNSKDWAVAIAVIAWSTFQVYCTVNIQIDMLQNMRRRDGILPRLGDDPLRIARLGPFQSAATCNKSSSGSTSRLLTSMIEFCHLTQHVAGASWCWFLLERYQKNRRHYESSAISWSHRPKSTSEAQPRKGPAVSTAANSMPTPVLWQNWPPNFAVPKVPRQASSISTLHFQNIKISNHSLLGPSSFKSLPGYQICFT